MDALSNLKQRLTQAKAGFSSLVGNALKSRSIQNLGAWKNILENNQLPEIAGAFKSPLPQNNLQRMGNAGVDIASTIVGGGMQGGYNISSAYGQTAKNRDYSKVPTGAKQVGKAALTLQGTRAPVAALGFAGFGGAIKAGGDILAGKSLSDALPSGLISGIESIPSSTTQAGAWAAINPITKQLLAPITSKLAPKPLENLGTYLNLAKNATSKKMQDTFFSLAAKTVTQGLEKAALESFTSMGIYGGVQPAKTLKERVKNILTYGIQGAVVGTAMKGAGYAYTYITKGPVGWKAEGIGQKISKDIKQFGQDERGGIQIASPGREKDVTKMLMEERADIEKQLSATTSTLQKMDLKRDLENIDDALVELKNSPQVMRTHFPVAPKPGTSTKNVMSFINPEGVEVPVEQTHLGAAQQLDVGKRGVEVNQSTLNSFLEKGNIRTVVTPTEANFEFIGEPSAKQISQMSVLAGNRKIYVDLTTPGKQPVSVEFNNGAELLSYFNSKLSRVSNAAPTVEELTTQFGKWESGDLRRQFDSALLHKDAETVKRLLPNIPEKYRDRFANEISAVTGETSKLGKEAGGIRFGAEVGGPQTGIPEGMKERSFIQTAKEAPIVPKEVKETIKGFYTPVSDQVRMDEARGRVFVNYQGTLDDFNKNQIPPQNIVATGEALIEKALKEGRNDDATKLIEDLAVKGTNLGQGVQTFAVFGRLTPEGMLNYAQKEINKSNTNKSSLDKVIGKITKRSDAKLTPEDTAYISDLMKRANEADNDEEKSAIVKKVLERIGSKIPWGASDVIDTYRYNNMLSNPLTHLRNAVNNLMQTFITRPATLAASGKPLEAAKYEIGALKSVPDGIDAFVTSLKEGRPLGKLDTATIKGLKPIQKPPLGKYNLPSDLMEASDQLFQKIISGGETARGATPEAAKSMAEYSLFRQDLNPAGQGPALNKIDTITKGAYKLREVGLGWFIPFIRTPMNVAKQWIEYSPAGVATIPGAGNQREQLGKALLGSTATLIGAHLALQGRVTWSAPTDPTAKQLFYDSGKKPYSVRIGDKWVPLQTFGVFAWALGIPAAIKHYTEDSRTALTDDTLTKITSIPMSLTGFWSNQTFVSGLGSFVDLARGTSGGITPANIAKNVAYVAGQMKPMAGLMRYVSTVIDPIYRDAGNVKEQLMSDVPELSKQLPAYEDITGQPSTRNISNYVAPYGMGQVPAGERGPSLEIAYTLRQTKLQMNAITTAAKNKKEALTKRLKNGTITEKQWVEESLKITEEFQKRMQELQKRNQSSSSLK
jgi:hypothetical protein